MPRHIPIMVYIVQMAQGLSEKGAGKTLPKSQLLADMVRHVVSRRKEKSLFVMYYADGKTSDLDLETSVERKVLEEMVAIWCPGVDIVAKNSPFMQTMQLTYFKRPIYFISRASEVGTITFYPSLENVCHRSRIWAFVLQLSKTNACLTVC